MSAALLPEQFDTLLTLYKQVKSYHPESTNSFMAIKTHANNLKANLEKNLKGPINMSDYECWYEIQADKELDSQVPYLKYKDEVTCV
jgi:hypothetical protein